MKITRKVLVAILTLALLVTCFAVSVFAVDETAAEDESYKAVLEYYESAIYFSEDFSETAEGSDVPAFYEKTFDEFEFTLSGTVGNVRTTFKIVSDATYGDYLNIGTNNNSSFKFVPKKVESFGINFRASLTNAKSAINVLLNGSSSVTLLEIKPGAVSVYDSETEALVEHSSTITNVDAATPAFFDVQLFYSLEGEKATLNVVVTEAGGSAKTYTADVSKLSFNGFAINVNRACFDYMEAYAGSFARRTEDNEAEIAAYINKIVADYDAAVLAGAADADKYLDVVYKVVDTYKYSTANITDTTLKATTDASISKALASLAVPKAKAFVDGAAAINTQLSYDERVAVCDELTKYNTFITELKLSNPGVDLGQTDEALTAARNALAEEIAALNKIATDSAALIEAIDAMNGMKYFDLSAATDAIAADVAAADLTYAGVADAVAKYNGYVNKIAATTALGLAAELEEYYAAANPVNDELVAKYFNKVVELYTADKAALGALDAIYKLYNVLTVKNYTTANISDAALKAATDASIKTVCKVIGEDYAAKLVEGVSKIDTTAAYNTRLTYTNDLKVYVDLLAWIKTNHSDITLETDAEALAAAEKAYTDEVAALAKLAADTKAAVAIANSVDVTTATYKALRTAYEELLKYPVCETFTDSETTAAAVSAAIAKVEQINKAYAELDAKAKTFVENVLKADNTGVTDSETAEQFAARYQAYLLAKENYFTDTTYNEYLENTTVEALLVIYGAVETEMRGETDSSEAFIAAVEAAKGPLTYFALVEALEAVKPYIAGANFGYPGVKEAHDEYTALADKVANNYQKDLANELLFFVNKHYYFNEDFSEGVEVDGTSDVPAFYTKTFEEFEFSLSGTVGNKRTTFKIVNDATYGDYMNLGTNNPSSFSFVPKMAGSFGVNFRVALSNAKSAINLVLNGEESTALLKIEVGSVSVYDADTGALVANESTITNTAATAPDFFDVQLLYRVQGDKATFYAVITLSDGSSTTYVSEVNKVDFTGFQITVNRACFDSMQAFAGDTIGTPTPELLAKTVNKLVEFYDKNPNADYAPELLEAITDAVVLYGFDYNTVTDAALKATTEASVIKALTNVGNKYAATFVAGVNAINKNAAYNDRLNYAISLEKLELVLGLIQKNHTSIAITTDATAIEAARAAYVAEVAELEKAAADTKAAYDAVIVVPDFIFATYKDLRVAYEAILTYPICATFYDSVLSAEEVARAIQLAASIKAEYERINAMAESFVDGVVKSDNTNVTEDEAPEAFRARYDAYIKAKANFYNDAAYDEYLVAKYNITLAELHAIYEAVNTEMVAKIEFAESFLTAVNEATLTLSYSVKLSILQEWDALRADVELGYPGVADAMNVYASVATDVENKRNATKAYIEAVLAIATATDKQAAIVYAKSLAANGSDVSVDVTVQNADGALVGVSDANIILSNLEGDVLVVGLRNKNFIDAVAAIAAKTAYADKRAAIVNALALQTRADAADAGVVAAVASLNAAIADYNNGVNAANQTMENAANLATSVTAKVAPTQSMAQVVAIIKKFYE